jgi:hypothetical protein
VTDTGYGRNVALKVLSILVATTSDIVCPVEFGSGAEITRNPIVGELLLNASHTGTVQELGSWA